VKQSRSKNLSPLGKYLWDNRISDMDFAAQMKGYLGVEKFSSSTVENWRYGRGAPKGENLAAIKALTGLSTDHILGLDA
jgi:hypothetical protein